MDQECDQSLKESKTLAGVFTSLLQECKSFYPSIEEFLQKSSKLESQLRSTLTVFSSFVESFEQIANKTCNMKGGSNQDIGLCLLNLCAKHKSVEKQLEIITSTFGNVFLVQLKSNNRQHKQKLKVLEKSHKKEYKKLRKQIDTKIGTIDKLKKKINPENKTEMKQQIEEKRNELYTDYKLKKKINLEGRAHLCDFTDCFKQVVIEEINIANEFNCMREILENMSTLIDDPQNIPDTKHVINNIMESGAYSQFYTPTSSVNGSLQGSRYGSLTSLGSNSRSETNFEKASDEYTENAKDRLSRISFYSQDGIQDIKKDDIPTRRLSRSRFNSTGDVSRTRRQSASPSRHTKNNQTLSTVRRAPSPCRKQVINSNSNAAEYSARRPPIPKKYQPVIKHNIGSTLTRNIPIIRDEGGGNDGNDEEMVTHRGTREESVSSEDTSECWVIV